VFFAFAANSNAQTVPIPTFRPPSVPLIVMDPYFTIWSGNNNLTDSWATLWDGTIKAFVGLIRIDGKAYRFLGPYGPPPMQQISVVVYPTRTVYEFQVGGVQLELTFTTPILPNSLDLLSRPVTYLTFDVWSYDGANHDVQLYYDNTGEIAVNQVTEQITWAATETPRNKLFTLSTGTAAQAYLGQTGDNIGINWGHFYAATPPADGVSWTTNLADLTRQTWTSNGKLVSPIYNMPQPVNNGWQVLAFSFNLGQVGSSPVSRVILVAYDDVYSINYFGTFLRAYWHTIYTDIYSLLDQAWDDYASLSMKSANFDQYTLRQSLAVGGAQYATIIALAYRQTVGGTKLTWNPEKKLPWYFMKEISSDGDVSTVDVIFPASPLFLYYNATLLGLQLLPIFSYANNETNKPYSLVWAPHHLGQWPVADILTSQQENMPIEETANMLMMVAGVAQASNYDVVLKNRAYWALLQQWGDYLVSALPDPESQTCTDDFEGPIPHDSNLAVKGIIGIAAFAKLNALVGNAPAASKYNAIAQQYAAKWLVLSNPDNQNHYRLRYDEPGWSLKYNILYQFILNITVFPQYVVERELDYYLTKLNPYGVPLDVRRDYTKLDWESWVAAVAPNPNDFALIIDGIYQFATKTPQRVPLSDWYFTSTGAQQGFQARTVVGGVWAKLLLTEGAHS